MGRNMDGQEEGMWQWQEFDRWVGVRGLRKKHEVRKGAVIYVRKLDI